MTRKLPVLLLLLLLLLPAGCRGEGEGNLTFRNDSDTPVGRVSIARISSSCGGLRADGEPLGRGDTLSFLEDPDDAPRFTLTVYDAAGKRALAQSRFSLSFAGGQTHLITLTGAGSSLTLQADPD